MPKRLFNEYEALTDEAIDYIKEVEKALNPIIEKYADGGYSLRDLSLIAAEAVQLRFAEIILSRSILARRNARKIKSALEPITEDLRPVSERR